MIPFLIISAAVVVAFFVCYAPYQTQRLLFFYVTNTRDPFYNKVNHYLYVISGNVKSQIARL